MTLTINLLDVPKGGVQIDSGVMGSELGLSPDDGEVIDPLNCSGHLTLPDEHTAYFQGALSGRVARECVRCLALFEDILFLPCEAVFRSSNKPSALSETKREGPRVRNVVLDEDDAELEAYSIIANHVDLFPMVREHLILAAPMQCLCQENCLGLCQVCGVNLNEGVCGCYMPVTFSSVKIDTQYGVRKPNHPGTTRKGS